MSCFPQWLKSLVCPRLTRPRPPPSSHLRPPAPSTSCLCCCAFDNAAVTCLSSRRWRTNCPNKSWGLVRLWETVFTRHRLTLFFSCLRSDSWLLWAPGWRDRSVPGGAAQCHVAHLQPLALRPGPQSHRVPQWHSLPLAAVWGHQFKH